MVAPLIGIAAGLGIAGLEALTGRRQARRAETRQDQAQREQLNLALQDDRLNPNQFKRVIAAQEFDPGVGLDMYNAFKAGNAAEATRIEDARLAGVDLKMRQDAARLEGKKYDLSLERFLMENNATNQARADWERSLVDPQFAISKAEAGQQEITQDIPGVGLVRLPIPGTEGSQGPLLALQQQTASLDRVSELMDAVQGLTTLEPDPASPEMARINSLRSEVLIDAKNLAELGALSGGDFELVNKWLGAEPGTFLGAIASSPDAIISSLDTFAQSQAAALASLRTNTQFFPELTDAVADNADRAFVRSRQRGAGVADTIAAEQAAEAAIIARENDATLSREDRLAATRERMDAEDAARMKAIAQFIGGDAARWLTGIGGFLAGGLVGKKL